MNKKEAARFLGVTTRSLERYVSQNKLKVVYAQGKTRSIATFDPADLEKLKQEMASSLKPGLIDLNGDNHAKPASNKIATTTPKAATKTRIKSSQATVNDQNNSEQIIKMVASVTANNKIMLTLAEASSLTSLSQRDIRKAIHTGQLVAGRKGRGWKIRRTDLQTYIDRLW